MTDIHVDLVLTKMAIRLGDDTLTVERPCIRSDGRCDAPDLCQECGGCTGVGGEP